MRKIYYFILAFVALHLTIDAGAQKMLRFIYVAHDENTVTQKLIYTLRDYFNDAINYPEEVATVFYLPNGSYPVVVRVNTEGDNQKEFDKIVEELQSKRSHEVSRDEDIAKIPELFNEIETDGYETFTNVEWIYFINSTFWELGYNESIVASVFWIMDMQKLIKSGHLDLKFFYEETDVLPIDNDHPFGLKNIPALDNFLPMPY